MKSLSLIGALAIIIAIAAAVFFFGGFYNVAATQPDLGINALDGVLQLFNNVNAMRQQLRRIPQAPVNGVHPPAEEKPVRPTIRIQEIQEGSAKLVRVKSEEVAVFNYQGQLCAIQNNCPHAGGQLSMGWVEGEYAVCPLHGYKFHLQTGACSLDPNLKVKTFKLVAQGDGFTVED